MVNIDSAAKYLYLGLVSLAVVGCPSGTLVVQGTVRDATTGEAIEGASVVQILDTFDGGCFTRFEERGKTNADGRYKIRVSVFMSTSIGISVPNFKLQFKGLERVPSSQTLDFDIQSIAAITGLWDVTLMIDGGGEVIWGQLLFDEREVKGISFSHSLEEPSDVGFTSYSFDGVNLSMARSFAPSCDTRSGVTLTTELTLNNNDESLVGTFQLRDPSLEECPNGCEGTLVLTRSES